MKGSVAAVGNLPANGNDQGDAYINQTDDSLWIWNGTTWISGGSIQGPQGIQGATGSQGIQGNPGADGADGADGAAGAKGDTGAAGADGADGADGNDGAQGIQGATGPQGAAGADAQNGIPSGGSAGEALVKTNGDDYSVEWAAATGGGGGVKYLLRLEYDVNESLITANTSFVTATGFETTGASVVSQSSNSGSNTGHNVTLNFADTNPPTSIIGYGWNPATGNYTVAAYDRDTKQVQYEVGIAAFTHQSTTDGASGASGQWGGAAFSGAGSYNIKLDVDQSALTYGNAVAGAFGNPSKLPHAYLIISF